MLKVVIRHIDAEEGKALGEFSPERVDALVELVKTYGVMGKWFRARREV